MLHIYNSLSGRKEAFPKTPKRVNMFVCGPTVYGDPHIGNGRTFMNHDIIARYMRSRGYRVFYLQNITDVDDKIIVRANEEQVSWKEIARRYERVYRENLKRLNIVSVNKYARATDHIPEMVRQIKTLIKKEYAYLIPEDGWYFDLSRFPEYGKLSGRTMLQAEDAVSRIDTSDQKRNRGDFCLWKFSKPGEPLWKTSLGPGRPGWHIEDTAITEHYFGSQYDIHGGGLDIKFPHHEAEIAQQESASGKKPFVKIWMHSGFLLVEGKKMSKSLGNFTTVNDLLARSTAEDFRMMCLSAHYRSPMDYTETVATSAAKNFKEMREFLAKLCLVEKKGKGNKTLDFSEYEDKFHTAMEDDFNTPEALAAIFELLRLTNKNIWDISRKDAERLKKWLRGTLDMLGFAVVDIKIPSKISKIAIKRELSRSNKQFAQSDLLRKEAESLGYSIEDTPLGPLVLPA